MNYNTDINLWKSMHQYHVNNGCSVLHVSDGMVGNASDGFLARFSTSQDAIGVLLEAGYIKVGEDQFRAA